MPSSSKSASSTTVAPIHTGVAASPPAPATTSSPVVLPTSPPDVVIPSPPANIPPIDLTAFRGFYAKASQVMAVPGVVTELSSPDAYNKAFGAVAPPVGIFVQTLSDAAGWTAIRVALEAYLRYAKGEEGVAWRSGVVQIDQLKAVYDVALLQNAQLPVQFPALSRLLGVTAQIGQKSASTRKRNKAAKAAKATAAAPSAAPAAPNLGAVASTTTTPTTANGGASH